MTNQIQADRWKILSAGALCAVALLVWQWRRSRAAALIHARRDCLADEASMQSFPASDPPSFTSAALPN
jgi:hypothetical protein